MVAVLHVFDKGVNDAVGIDGWTGESNGEVEEVAALAALVKGAKLGGQQFVERIRVDFAVPWNQRELTANGCRMKPRIAKCSRVLISTFSRSSKGGTSSDWKR